MDYSELVETANSLISEYGAKVNLIKVEGLNIDALKPWKSNPAGTGVAETLEVDAVSVSVKSASEMGFSFSAIEMMKSSHRVFIVAPGTSSEAESLEKFNFLEYDGIRAKIDIVDKLKPAQTTLLYVFGVSR